MEFLLFRRFSSTIFCILILFATSCNLYYLGVYNNQFVITTVDRYGGDAEWLKSSKHTGVLNPSYVVGFINGTDSGQDIVARMNQVDIEYVTSADELCITLGGRTSSTLYAICDPLPLDQVPHWAKDFEGVMIQTVYISTLQEYKQGRVSIVAGAFQAFRLKRDTYYRHNTIAKGYCSTSNLASKGENKQRTLYTAEHGVLKSVNCDESNDRSYFGCVLIKDSNRHMLVDNAYIDELTVYVDESSGQEYIMQPWTEKVKLGSYTDQVVQWPIDGCLFIRKGEDGLYQLGWFGLGYSDYEISLSAAAAIAKIQLILLAAITSLVDTRQVRFALLYLYEPLVKTTRLGVFHVITAQNILASMNEIDIFRTIYALSFQSLREYIFYSYLFVSVGITITLCSFSAVRCFGGTWNNRVGNLMCFLNLYVGIFVIHSIGMSTYSTYTIENGMQYEHSTECPEGFSTCSSRTSFNKISLVALLILLPVSVEIMQYIRIYSKKQSKILTVVTKPCNEKLSSFERHCLCGLELPDVVPDTDQHYQFVSGNSSKKKACIAGEMVGVCGFTIIKGRFILRTRDLYLLILAKIFHKLNISSKKQSVVLWKIEYEDGIPVVSHMMRRFLYMLEDEKIDGMHAGILAGEVRAIG